MPSALCTPLRERGFQRFERFRPVPAEGAAPGEDGPAREVPPVPALAPCEMGIEIENLLGHGPDDARVRAEGIEERSRPTLLRANDEEIGQRPLSGVEFPQPEEGGLGDGRKATGSGEAGAVDG